MEKSAQYTIPDALLSKDRHALVCAQMIASSLEPGLSNLSLEELRFTKLLLQQLRTSVLKKLASVPDEKREGK